MIVIMCHIHYGLNYKNGVSTKTSDNEDLLTGWYRHTDQLDTVFVVKHHCCLLFSI